MLSCSVTEVVRDFIVNIIVYGCVTLINFTKLWCNFWESLFCLTYSLLSSCWLYRTAYLQNLLHISGLVMRTYVGKDWKVKSLTTLKKWAGERLQVIKSRSRWRSGIRIGSRTTSASSSRFAILLIMSRYLFYVLRVGHRLRSSPTRAGEAQTLSISTPRQDWGEAKQEARTVLAGKQSLFEFFF